MAGGAGDAVARQRRVVRKLAHLVAGLERDGVQSLARKRLARALLRMLVDDELALALHGVAAETGVLHDARRLRMEGLGLARKLREEDRIAPGEALGRGAPRPVGREVDHLVARSRLRHVELQAGAAGAVAADAQRRGHEHGLRGGLAGRRPDMVVGFRRQLCDRQRGRRRLALQSEGLRENGRIGRVRRRLLLRLRLRDRLVVELDIRIEHEGLAEEHQRIARLTLDVAQGREGVVVARRSMAIGAIEPEAHVGIVVGLGCRPVRPPVVLAPAEPAPVPAVMRAA